MEGGRHRGDVRRLLCVCVWGGGVKWRGYRGEGAGGGGGARVTLRRDPVCWMLVFVTGGTDGDRE